VGVGNKQLARLLLKGRRSLVRSQPRSAPPPQTRPTHPPVTAGVVGVYCMDHGGVGAVADAWKKIRGRDGGFISG